MLKLVQPNRWKTLRRRGYGRRSLGSAQSDSRSTVMAGHFELGGTVTRDLHISGDAPLPPALRSKRTLVERSARALIDPSPRTTR